MYLLVIPYSNHCPDRSRQKSRVPTNLMGLTPIPKNLSNTGIMTIRRNTSCTGWAKWQVARPSRPSCWW